MRILAVDDDPVILELLERSLSARGSYDLTTCKSAEEAQAEMNSDPVPFDCFLLDVMLPGVDGIELCDAIRQTRLYRATPIIMITASREPDLMQRAFHAGATDFICKPLEGVELGARINSAAMLNESLNRERQVRHTLSELSAKMKVRFDEPVKLGTARVGDLLGLENTLLRMPAGCYAMTLFAIDVLGLRAVHRSVTPIAFVSHLEAVAAAATDALSDRTFLLSYAGSGRFMGVLMGRDRFPADAVLTEMNATLSADWDEGACAAPIPPALRITQLSDQRLWSGLSASDVFRRHLQGTDLMQGVAAEEEDNLFARLADIAGGA